MAAAVYVIPKLVPISELRVRQNEILSELGEMPVVLTQHGREAAVLVSSEQWNGLLAEIEDLRDALDALEARQEAEPTTIFEDYLNERGKRVSSEVGQ